MDIRAEAEQLSAAIQVLGTPERAASERAYLKSDLEFFGTAVPATRAVVKRFLRVQPGLTHDELIDVCQELWRVPVHERRTATVELLTFRPALLSPADLPWIEQLLRDSKTWALVDELARQVVAGLAIDHPDVLATLDRWVADDDFWIRRSAVLSLSKLLRDDRELDRFFRYADTLLPEKEFFIRKVLGWVARELGRHQPTAVSAWLQRNQAIMNGVTIREAVKYLPDGPTVLESWKSR